MLLIENDNWRLSSLTVMRDSKVNAA